LEVFPVNVLFNQSNELWEEVQGHNKEVMETAKMSNLVKQVFTLDPTFKATDLDTAKLAPNQSSTGPRSRAHEGIAPDHLPLLRPTCCGKDRGTRAYPRRMALPELGVPTTTVLHRIPSMGCWRQEAPGNAKDLWRLEGINGINRHE